ncbi:MAG: TIGR03013 family XrtA/PEP-CTERM system glycosyltransferase [Granulosicoccaceae bacterium]
MTELLVCMGAVQLAALIRFGGSTASIAETLPSLSLATVVFGVVMTVSLVAFGLYQAHFRGGALGVLMRIALGFLAGSIALMMVFYLFPNTYMGRGVTGIAIVVSFFTIGTIRPLFLPLVEQDTLKRRIAVIGTGTTASTIFGRLRRRADRRGFYVVHFLDFNEGNILVDSDRVHEAPKSLYEYCRKNDIQELVVALDDRRSRLPGDQLIDCRLKGIKVVEIHTFFEREAGFLPLDLVKPSWFIYADGFRVNRAEEVLKRLTDITASLLLLAISWPVMLITALAIKIECRFNGPIFYSQDRVGFAGRNFGVIKFRSMTVDAEKDGAQWATKNDARVTKVGEIIRMMRIDELPQILNVLRGDMSLVGPRPERPNFVEELTQKVPYYAERHQVKPGLTGWAQVSYPYGASDEDARKKHEFDLYYVKNHTLFLDIFIMLQTVEVVLLGKGAR